MTDNELITARDAALATAMMPEEFGEAADDWAARGVFAAWRSGQARQTIVSYQAALDKFAKFLNAANGGPTRTGEQLMTDVSVWANCTRGIVLAFQKWLLDEGYAIATVNCRVTVVKTFARLAGDAGVIGSDMSVMIRGVQGLSQKKGRRRDEERMEAGTPTRVSNQKMTPVTITLDQARQLKAQPDTPRGRRDRLIMCLLIDLGMRVGEVVGLDVADFDLAAGKLTFWREKTNDTQTHLLKNGTLAAARAYLDQDAPAIGTLLRGSRKGKGGALTGSGMNRRSITRRVGTLGRQIGVEGLTAHDLRHHWTTRAFARGDPIDCIMQAGGWSSYAMPLRYRAASEIANEGMTQDDD